VAKDGHLISETYYANSSESQYEADSLAKTMTAQIVGVAVTQGLLDLDVPIQKYGVLPRCAGVSRGGPSYKRTPPSDRCAHIIHTLCPHVAPPFDCPHSGDAVPQRNSSSPCSEQCLENK
jgi:hypothetical protein